MLAGRHSVHGGTGQTEGLTFRTQKLRRWGNVDLALSMDSREPKPAMDMKPFSSCGKHRREAHYDVENLPREMARP